MYAGIIALGKEALYIHQALYRANDPVLGQGSQYAKDNEFDLQEESDNEFVMREDEAASLAKSLLDYDTGIKHISQVVTANTPSTLLSHPQRKQHQVRLMSTTTKNKHKTLVSKPTTTRMQSTSPARKSVKTPGGHTIGESIRGIVEELKKTREEKIGPILLAFVIRCSYHHNHFKLLLR